MKDPRLDGAGPFGAIIDWTERHPGPVDVILAVAAVGILAPSSIQLIAASGRSTAWMVILGIGIAALHLPMVVRRTRPRLAYAIGCGGMLALTLAPYLHTSPGELVPGPLLPSALLFFVLLYTAAEQLDSPWAAACLVVALLGGAIVLIRLSTGEPWWSQVTGQSTGSAWLVLTALILAGAVGAYSLGRLRRIRRAYLAELEDRAVRTEADRLAEAAEAAEAERRRIAREMHDVVSHSLAVMISQAEGGRMLSAGSAGDPRSGAVFGTIAATGRVAMGDMRAMLGLLRDDDEPVRTGQTPQPGLADLPQLVEHVRSAGCDVALTEAGTPVPLSPAVSLSVFRLLQESLTNVVKHAGDHASARVVLTWHPDELSVEVCDDGHPTADPSDARGGSGLVGMRERIETLGGTLSVGRTTGREATGREATGREATGRAATGWRVAATVPVPAPDPSPPQTSSGVS